MILRNTSQTVQGPYFQAWSCGVGAKVSGDIVGEVMILYLMGVSGSGKSTVGLALAKQLGIPFEDGDDYHSTENKQKMARGVPLDDDDRRPWLMALNQLAREADAQGKSMVIACSALKSLYREWLTKGLASQDTSFILLEGSRALIAERLNHRQHEFMNPSLLANQLATLEEPEDAIRVNVDGPVEEITREILQKLAAAGAQTL